MAAELPQHRATLGVPAGGMSVPVKSLENVRNQKAKSNLLSLGTVLCHRAGGESRYLHKMSEMKLLCHFLKSLYHCAGVKTKISQ